MSEGQLTTEARRNPVSYTVQQIEVGQLPSGESLYLHKHEFIGNPGGPRVYIQANIHGPELTGIPVVLKLIERLKSQDEINGTITLIPTANPVGLDIKIGGSNVGYTNLRRQNGSNWNRGRNYAPEIIRNSGDRYRDRDFEDASRDFEADYIDHIANTIETSRRNGSLTTEQMLSLNLQRLSFGHDVFIDVHTAGNNIEHVYTYPHSVDIARRFGFKFIVETLENNGYFQDAFMTPNIDLWRFLGHEYPSATLPKHAFTVELSGRRFDEQYIDQAVQRFWRLFGEMGIIQTEDRIEAQQEQFLVKDTDVFRYSAPHGGIFLPSVNIGDQVVKDQIIAKVLEINTGQAYEINSRHDGYIYTFSSGQAVDMGEPSIGIFANPQRL